ncbi:MAG: hypothetical protein R2707_04120 [Acidimicrobiales bacterium]
MTLRVRMLRLVKRLLRIGKPGDSFYASRSSHNASADAGRAEFDADTRSMQGL